MRKLLLVGLVGAASFCALAVPKKDFDLRIFYGKTTFSVSFLNSVWDLLPDGARVARVQGVIVAEEGHTIAIRDDRNPEDLVFCNLTPDSIGIVDQLYPTTSTISVVGEKAKGMKKPVLILCEPVLFPSLDVVRNMADYEKMNPKPGEHPAAKLQPYDGSHPAHPELR